MSIGNLKLKINHFLNKTLYQLIEKFSLFYCLLYNVCGARYVQAHVHILYNTDDTVHAILLEMCGYELKSYYTLVQESWYVM